MAERISIPLRAVVYREGDWWIAHCLELDLVAEGKSPFAALKDVLDLAEFQIRVAMEDGDLDSIFRAAPPEVWRMFSLAEAFDFRRKPPKPVDRFETRSLALA